MVTNEDRCDCGVIHTPAYWGDGPAEEWLTQWQMDRPEYLRPTPRA